MNLKKMLPLGVALVLGLVSARLVLKTLHSKAAVAANGPKMTSVVTAGRDLDAGEELGSDNLTVGQIVADSAPGKIFADPAELTGRVAAAPLVRGQAVLESLLAPKGTGSGLQALIPRGMRALTLDINEISGVAGYITPDSRVDVIQTLHEEGTNRLVGRVVVQNVKVTAVGIKGVAADGGMAHSVTLLVTPRQAEMVDMASLTGRPRLVLRNGRDDGAEDVANVTQAELTGIPATQPAVAVAAPIQSLVDPFVPTTRPAAASTEAPQWTVRVIAAGEVSEVNLQLPKGPVVTGSDTGDVNNP